MDGCLLKGENIIINTSESRIRGGLSQEMGPACIEHVMVFEINGSHQGVTRNRSIALSVIGMLTVYIIRL